MPVLTDVFDPPFNIFCAQAMSPLMSSISTLSRDFTPTSSACTSRTATATTVYLRGSEEHQHHSLVLRKAATAACDRLGFKVGNEDDLDKAASFFSANGIPYAFVEPPFQGRTLQFTDPFGFQIEFYARWRSARICCSATAYTRAAIPAPRPFQLFAADVQATFDFYDELGFRLTEYTENDDTDGRISGRGCTAKAMSTISPSPTAAARGCTTSASGRRPRSTSCISAT